MKILQAIIEIPLNSKIKYEYDRESDRIIVDRILRDDFKYPANYGCIREALDWDGDPLDILVYSEHSFVPGSILNLRIVGAMKMIDDGETDTKLIGVLEDDYKTEHIKCLKDLPQDFLNKIKTFFETYKNWKRKGITSVPGFEDAEWASQEYKECVGLMAKYGNMPKDEFIAKMKKDHPEKYTF